MHKVITRNHYEKETARFYYGKELLLEILDILEGYNVGEHINIGGDTYLLYRIVSYPEITITDYHLMKG